MTLSAEKPAATDLGEAIRLQGAAAKQAARVLSVLGRSEKDAALEHMAVALEEAQATVLAANRRDVTAAEERGLTGAMVDRLRLDEERLSGVIRAVREVAALDDPVGQVIRSWSAAQGVQVEKRRTPIGVIGIIYESRPNVTVDAATLCFKAGNAVLLRGGSEAFHSNQAFGVALQEGLRRAGLPAGCVQLVPATDREGVRHMAELDEALDLIIPRGGHQLIETVVSLARMPVLKHYDGICHVYVDRAADLDMASRISLNAKVQRPGVCNAMETLLVHRDVAQTFLERHVPELREAGVEVRGCEATRDIVPDVVPATEADWPAEYLALVLAVKVVSSDAEAADHIARWGSSHTDAIVTEDEATAERFLAAVDSSTVLWNASPRFADGGQFGFGAEIGISTDKLHARGPMALEELTIYKYVARGTGQVRE